MSKYNDSSKSDTFKDFLEGTGVWSRNHSNSNNNSTSFLSFLDEREQGASLGYADYRHYPGGVRPANAGGKQGD